jgi:Zn-dependent M28 family amino/carboxypeptidase
LAFEPRRIPAPPAAVVRRARTIHEALDRDRMRRTLEELPGPRTRLHFPAAMERAEALLVSRFADAGWDVTRRHFEVARTAEAYGVFAGLFPDAEGANVIATRHGRSPRDVLVVGAHHDTLPETPGADDNGAGLVALLELARLWADRAFERSIVLVAFDHEEIGVHGARRFVWDLAEDEQLHGAIIYETMAYTSSEPGSQEVPAGFGLAFPRQVRRVRARGSRGDWTALIHRADSARLAARLASVLRALEGEHAALLLRDPVDLPVIGPVLKYLVPPLRNLARSDHLAFWDAGLPAVQLTDTANFRNPHYHQPTDTPGTVDLERLAAIIAATAVTVEVMAGASPV